MPKKGYKKGLQKLVLSYLCDKWTEKQVLETAVIREELNLSPRQMIQIKKELLKKKHVCDYGTGFIGLNPKYAPNECGKVCVNIERKSDDIRSNAPYCPLKKLFIGDPKYFCTKLKTIRWDGDKPEVVYVPRCDRWSG